MPIAYFIMDIQDMLDVHGVSFREKDWSAKCGRGTAVKQEQSPPYSSSHFSLKEADVPIRELTMQAKAKRHACC
jgi:hypothetical protein